MKLSDDQIRKIIREEIGKRYTILHDKEIIQDLNRIDEFALPAIPIAVKIGAGLLGLGAVGSATHTWFDNMGSIDVADGEISDQEKLAAAFGEGGVSWSTYESKLGPGGELESIQVISATDIFLQAEKINDSVTAWSGTDEDAIYDAFRDMDSIIDIRHLAHVYEEKYDETLFDAINGDMNSDEMNRVRDIIIDKPLMVVKPEFRSEGDSSGRVEDSAEAQQRAIDNSEEAAEVAAAEEAAQQGSDSVRRLQTALGTRVTGKLNANDTDALLNDLERLYIEEDGKPTKLQIATDIQARVRSLPAQIIVSGPNAGLSPDGVPEDGMGGTGSFERLGLRSVIRSDYWGGVAQFVERLNQSQVQSESKRYILERAIILEIRNQKKQNNLEKIEEGWEIDISRFESSEPEQSTTTRRGSSRNRDAEDRDPGDPHVKTLQGIVGAPSCNDPGGCDGVWGPNTQTAWANYIVRFLRNSPQRWQRNTSQITSSWPDGGAEIASRMSRDMGGEEFAATIPGAVRFLRWLPTANFGASAARVYTGSDPDGAGGSRVIIAPPGSSSSRPVSSTFDVDESTNYLNREQEQAIGSAVSTFARGPGIVNIKLFPERNDAGSRKIKIEATPSNIMPRGFIGMGTQRDELRSRLTNLRLPGAQSIVVTVTIKSAE